MRRSGGFGGEALALAEADLDARRGSLLVRRGKGGRRRGPLISVVDGATRGRLRHGHAVEMAREGVPLIVIQRQLGDTNLSITSVNLQGTDNTEIIGAVHSRRAPCGPGPQLAARLKAQCGRWRGSRDFLTAGPRPKREPGRGGAAAVKAAPRDEFAVAVRSWGHDQP